MEEQRAAIGVDNNLDFAEVDSGVEVGIDSVNIQVQKLEAGSSAAADQKSSCRAGLVDTMEDAVVDTVDGADFGVDSNLDCVVEAEVDLGSAEGSAGPVKIPMKSVKEQLPGTGVDNNLGSAVVVGLGCVKLSMEAVEE